MIIGHDSIIIMRELPWYEVQSSDFSMLIDDVNCNFVPEQPDIYQWRMNIAISPSVASSSEQIIRRIDQITKRPSGIIKDATINSTIKTSITIGGHGLTEKKSTNLFDFMKNKKVRIYTARFINSLKLAAPILYIGKADNLKKRIKQHLNNESDFSTNLINNYHLSFDDLVLYYCPVVDSDAEKAKDYLELLELISQRIINPFAVERMG